MSLDGSNLGGGNFNGYSPTQTINNYKDSEQTMTRTILRTGWNTQYANKVFNGRNRIITPFRAVNNAGDFLSRTNYSCGKLNPTSCDNSGIPPAACNTKYVYDSSDYIKFRKQQAVNRTYNDKSFGGYNNASYVALMAVRRR